MSDKPWDEKGCPVCREQWLNGTQPPRIAVSRVRHAFLHCCPVCHTLWEALERYATDISREEAVEHYGEEALKGTAC